MMGHSQSCGSPSARGPHSLPESPAARMWLARSVTDWRRPILQPAFEHRVPRRIQVLLHMPEAAKARPSFSHRVGVEGVEGVERRRIEMHYAGVASLRPLELFV